MIFCKKICGLKKSSYLCNPNAEIAQLVEHDLAKVGVASSSLVFRSLNRRETVVMAVSFLFDSFYWTIDMINAPSSEFSMMPPNWSRPGPQA